MDTTAHTSEAPRGLARRAARLRGLARAGAAVAATGAVAGALLAGGPAFAAVAAHHTTTATPYTFTTLATRPTRRSTSSWASTPTT